MKGDTSDSLVKQMIESDVIQKAFDIFSQIFNNEYPNSCINDPILIINTAPLWTDRGYAVLGQANYDYGLHSNKIIKAKIIVCPLIDFVYPYVSWYHVIAHEFGHIAHFIDVDNYAEWSILTHFEQEKAADRWMFDKLKLIEH